MLAATPALTGVLFGLDGARGEPRECITRCIQQALQ